MKSQKAKHNMNLNFIWILAGLIFLLLLMGISAYAQEQGEYTLFVGEFENRTDLINPLLDFVNDTLDFLFSRSKLAEIHPISPGLRSAYLQRARNEQPDVSAAQLNLIAAEYAKADAVLLGSYTKTGAQWSMDAQLYMMRGGSRAKEDIHISGKDVYSLLDGIAAEVGKRLGTGQYVLLSTRSWEAYEAYRQGHQAYYHFDTMGAIWNFQQAIELDPQLAIAYAELGMCYLMLNDADKSDKPFAEAIKNLRNAGEQEKLIVMGLASYYERGRKGANGTSWWHIHHEPDIMPRMRSDMVWDEPWLHWNIAWDSDDKALRSRELKQWLTSAFAYAKAGFYGAQELAITGVLDIKQIGYEMPGRCVQAFKDTKDPQFLEAAPQLIGQAADVEANDEYDDVWKHWELSRIYSLMGSATDVQQQREEWLRVVKSKPLNNLSPDAINDIARKCLEIGLPKDALEFAEKAVKLKSDPNLHSQCLVTLADAHLASDGLDEAFGAYMDAFEIFARGDADTVVLADSLWGLTRLMHDNPEFVDELKRAKLNEMMKTIENMDPLLFRGNSANETMTKGRALPCTIDLCLALGDIGPALTVARGILKAETEPSESLKYKYTLVYIYQTAGKYDEAKAFVRADGDIILEAEDAVSITPRLQVGEDKDASNGKYITGSPDTPGKPVGEAEYTFEVSKPGDYSILGRALAPHGKANSFFVSVDDGEKHIWDIYEPSSWWWWVVMTIKLTAGKHTLRIGNSEDGTKLDMIAIALLQGE